MAHKITRKLNGLTLRISYRQIRWKHRLPPRNAAIRLSHLMTQKLCALNHILNTIASKFLLGDSPKKAATARFPEAKRHPAIRTDRQGR